MPDALLREQRSVFPPPFHAPTPGLRPGSTRTGGDLATGKRPLKGTRGHRALFRAPPTPGSVTVQAADSEAAQCHRNLGAR